MAQSYQNTSPTKFIYPEDDATRLSYDSLAYSDITGEPRAKTSMSTESLRLNGYHHPQPRPLIPPSYVDGTKSRNKRNYYQPTETSHLMEEAPEWFQQPRVRTCFFLSVFLSLSTVLVLTSGILDTEWIENLYLMGIRGMRAQGVADASLIKTRIHGPAIYLGNSRHAEHLQLTGEPEEGCESTIMLIRHCEKGDIRSHCNYPGYERSAYLASQFGDGDERWPAPSQIYALKAGGRGSRGNRYNFREIETVQFLAEKLKVDVDESYETSDRRKLVRTVLESTLNGDQCGKLTLISWKHSDIPKVAHLLGCGPFEGCPMDYKGKQFDEVWQIKYVYRSFHHGPKAEMTHKHWDIFGSVQYENFDPLAFSKSAGDYPKGGTSHAGRWADSSIQFFD